MIAVTEQVPVLLVIVTRPEVAFTEQAPVAAKDTVPVPLPPELPTVNVALKGWAVAGIPVTDSVACVASFALTVAGAEVMLL